MSPARISSRRARVNEKKLSKGAMCAILACAALILVEVLTRPPRRNVWVKTVGCHGFAKPINGYDGLHIASISRKSSRSFTPESGFCLCRGTIVVANRDCAKWPVDCDIECKAFDTKPVSDGPFEQTQYDEIAPSHGRECFGGDLNRVGAFDDRKYAPNRTEILRVFDGFIQAARKPLREIRLPSSRKSIKDDFVYQGRRMRAVDIARIRRAIDDFQREAPKYDNTAFRGRGIVIVGGAGSNYATAYWIALLSIRRSGCTLPVEIWFPKGEFPSCDQVRGLHQYDALPRSFAPFDTHGWSSRFAYKLFAIVFSEFQSVIYMDADNIALKDPALLFATDLYSRFGVVLWKDFWAQSAAPDLFEIFPSDSLRAHNYSHETGQLVVDKPRVWRGLMLAAFMNYNARVFVELTVNYMGWGDKELLPRALQATKTPYGLVSFAPEHVGVLSGQRVFGNSMLQRSPADGAPTFLHANVGKISLHDFGPFSSHVRRWAYGTQLRFDLPRALAEASNTTDFERWVFVEALAFARSRASSLARARAWYDSPRISAPRPFLDGMFLDDHPGALRA